MAVGDFDNNYGNSPFPNLVTNTRQFYREELLRDAFTSHVVYNPFVTSQFDLREAATSRMTFTTPIEPHVNTDSIGLNTMWIPSSRIDSRSRDITISHYGDKIAFDKHSDYVTYWRQNGERGLARIVQGMLGGMLVKKLERLARNAFLSHPYGYFGTGSASSFGTIGQSDVLTEEAIDAIWLGMASRGVATAINPDTGNNDAIFCVTTPGVVSKLKQSTKWVETAQYANPNLVMRHELGMWHGVRFLQSNEALLANCGTITTQTTISASLAQGSGSPAHSTLVDGVFKSGQSSGVTNYIQLTSDTGFAVGDYITIHTDRTSAKGVTNGVDYTDGTITNRRIVGKPGSNRIEVDKPVMIDFTTDLGGGVYGYVTLARHINTATFIGGQMGVVLGVTQPPTLYTPDDLGIVDDFNMMNRFTWDGYMGYQAFEPDVFEVWYGAAPHRLWGPVKN